MFFFSAFIFSFAAYPYLRLGEGPAPDLQRCEDELLIDLSNATGDILENVTLVENLETTKRTARQIAHSMGVARATTANIASSRARGPALGGPPWRAGRAVRESPEPHGWWVW